MHILIPTAVDHLEDSVPNERIIFKRIFEKWDWGAWIGSIWLRTETGDRLL